jgi:hypothetical protein
LLCDPSTHSRFDGFGTVNAALAAHQLSLGSTFVMAKCGAAGKRCSSRTEPPTPSSKVASYPATAFGTTWLPLSNAKAKAELGWTPIPR